MFFGGGMTVSGLVPPLRVASETGIVTRVAPYW